MRSHQTPLVEQSHRTGQWDLSRQESGPVGDITAPYIAANDDHDRNRAVPMWLFVADGQRVLCRRPVEVNILEEDGEVIAACKRLHVFASGATYAEAVASFEEQVVHFCNEYKSLGADEVIGQAAQIRELYHQHFDIER